MNGELSCCVKNDSGGKWPYNLVGLSVIILLWMGSQSVTLQLIT